MKILFCQEGKMKKTKKLSRDNFFRLLYGTLYSIANSFRREWEMVFANSMVTVKTEWK